MSLSAPPPGGPSGRARVFVVDDHPIVRQGVRDLIESERDLSVCGEAGDIPEALTRIDELAPDVVLLDLSLGEGNGLDLLKRIKARGDRPAVLVLSIHEHWMYAERSLRAGASGYVNKAEAGEQVVKAIRRVLRGGIHLSEEMQSRTLRHALGKGTSERDPIERLSDRELGVFERIGRGLSTGEIAEALGVSVKTIETHRARIKEKLALDTGAQLVSYAVRWQSEQY